MDYFAIAVDKQVLFRLQFLPEDTGHSGETFDIKTVRRYLVNDGLVRSASGLTAKIRGALAHVFFVKW